MSGSGRKRTFAPVWMPDGTKQKHKDNLGTVYAAKIREAHKQGLLKDPV